MKTNFQTLINVWDQLDDMPSSMAVGSAYAKSMHTKPLSYYIERIAELPLGAGKVIDAGCGCGTWSFALRTKFNEVIGLDTSEERVQVAQWLANRGEMTGITFHVQSITDTELPDKSIDAVFCYSVLISAIPAGAALTEFYRILKPGGCIYVQLNGIGWSYYLRDERGRDEPRCDEMGRDGLYNTICQTRMKAWVELATQRYTAHQSYLSRLASWLNTFASAQRNRILRVGGTRIAERLSHYSDARGTHNFIDVGSCDLEAINRLCDVAQVSAKLRDTVCEVAEFIKRECGESYLALFVHDLHDLENGHRQTFHHEWAGRGYAPDEIESILERIGYCDFHWGEEGSLGNASSHVDPRCSGTFNGLLAAWEFVAHKLALSS